MDTSTAYAVICEKNEAYICLPDFVRKLSNGFPSILKNRSINGLMKQGACHL